MKTVLLLLTLLAPFILADRQLTRNEYDRIQEQFILPNRDFLLYLVFFTFTALLFTYPPETLVAAGVTSENLFSGFIGTLDGGILPYHCRRVVLNRALLFAYPFAFFVLLSFNSEAAVIFTFSPTRLIHYLANLSAPTLLTGVMYIIFHKSTDYVYIRPKRFRNRDMMTVDREIVSEALSLDSFSHTVSSSSRLLITRSWIIYSSKFQFQFIPLEEARLEVVKAEEIVLNPLNPEGAVQLMTIKISVPPDTKKSIRIKMHNLTLQDMIHAVNIRVHIPDTIKFKLSTIDRFANVFAHQAEQNEPYYVDSSEELEPCLACAEKPANMKIVKRCRDQNDGDRCDDRECQCRAMWCVHCMGKVFAAKQNQQAPGTWITGKAPCPTCRATFCVLDVAMIKIRED